MKSQHSAFAGGLSIKKAESYYYFALILEQLGTVFGTRTPHPSTDKHWGLRVSIYRQSPVKNQTVKQQSR